MSWISFCADYRCVAELSLSLFSWASSSWSAWLVVQHVQIHCLRRFLWHSSVSMPCPCASNVDFVSSGVPIQQARQYWKTSASCVSREWVLASWVLASKNSFVSTHCPCATNVGFASSVVWTEHSPWTPRHWKTNASCASRGWVLASQDFFASKLCPCATSVDFVSLLGSIE